MNKNEFIKYLEDINIYPTTSQLDKLDKLRGHDEVIFCLCQ